MSRTVISAVVGVVIAALTTIAFVVSSWSLDSKVRSRADAQANRSYQLVQRLHGLWGSELKTMAERLGSKQELAAAIDSGSESERLRRLAATATRGQIGSLSDETSNLTTFGNLAAVLRMLSLFALPLGAFLAGRAWDRHRRSRRTLTISWTLSFLTPRLLGLLPAAWMLELPQGDAQAQQAQTILVGMLGAIVSFVSLMPSVLSLIPGVLRACLRVKALLPESILPGWFLIAATPLYALLYKD